MLSMTLAALVVLTFPTPQDPPAVTMPSGDPKAVVALRIAIDGAKPVTVRVRAGERATVRVGDQPTVGLTPQIQGTSLDLVLTQVTDAETATTPDQQTAASAPELERVRLEPGTAVRLSAAAFSVEWIEVDNVLSPVVPGPDNPCRQCCISCLGALYCACSVDTVCGACCCQDCCTSVPGTDGGGATGAVCASRRIPAQDGSQF